MRGFPQLADHKRPAGAVPPREFAGRGAVCGLLWVRDMELSVTYLVVTYLVVAACSGLAVATLALDRGKSARLWFAVGALVAPAALLLLACYDGRTGMS